MILLQTFVAALLISFLGALPIGVLNLTALGMGLERGLRPVARFALGVVLVEYGQAYLALRFSDWMARSPLVGQIIQVGVVPLFFVLGLGYFLAKPKNLEAPRPRSKAADWRLGMLLSLANPLALPYWLLWSAYVAQQGWLRWQPLDLHVFALGVAVGAWLALMGFGWLGRSLVAWLAPMTRWMNRLIGAMFWLLAALQAWKLGAG